MVSLYGRLFAYRERRHRRPLEDFLTEALCDLLNRLPPEKRREFIKTHFLPPEAAHDWGQIVDNGGNLFWKTQEPIGADGRVDMLLFHDGKPLLVLENKIGAAGTGEQLARYGRWLACQVVGGDWRGALVFLTHFTAPPHGFATGDANTYGVPWQCVCRWPAVWQWLNTNASSHPADAWQVLAKELADFLREQGMTSETMTLNDLAAVEKYIASRDRVRRLFERIREAVRLVWTGWGAPHSPMNFDSQRMVIWDWFRLNGRRWYSAWGIAFPELGGWWNDADPPLPSRTYVFVGLFFDEDNQPLPAELQGRLGLCGWSMSATRNNSLIKARAICEFDLDPDRLAEQIICWVLDGARQLEFVIRDIGGAAQQNAG